MKYEARLTARVQAAIFEVNRNTKKYPKPITEEDFLGSGDRAPVEGPSDEELVGKFERAFGSIAQLQKSGHLKAEG